MKISKEIGVILSIFVVLIILNNIRINIFFLPNLKNEELCIEKINEKIPEYQDIELDNIIDTRFIFFEHKNQIDRITGLTPTDYVRWFVAYKTDPINGDRIRTEFAVGVISSKLKVYISHYNGGFN